MKTPYQQMVTDLVKPGADILTSLTAKKCNLIHMTWGITGEHLEILQAFGSPENGIRSDLKNLREEVSDLEFFCEGVMQEMGWEYSDIVKSYPEYLKADGPPVWVMLNGIENFSDVMKKHLMYNKPLSEEQTTLLRYSLARILTVNLEAMKAAGITREDALEANMQKLLKGDTARYKSGSYSDAQASDRADKV
jgi:NTP pyrophosphatase (non-canonical NTP hydrolase)